MKLVLRALKTVLRNKKKMIFKNRLKHLKRKCFSVLRQKQSCSHGIKNGCKNLQRFSFKPVKPFCLSSEQGFNVDINYLSNTLNAIRKTWRLSFAKKYKIRLFTYFTATASRILLYELTLEFFKKNSDFYICLELYSTKDFPWSVVLGCLPGSLNYHEGCTYFSLSQKFLHYWWANLMYWFGNFD